MSNRFDPYEPHTLHKEFEAIYRKARRSCYFLLLISLFYFIVSICFTTNTCNEITNRLNDEIEIRHHMDELSLNTDKELTKLLTDHLHDGAATITDIEAHLKRHDTRIEELNNACGIYCTTHSRQFFDLSVKLENEITDRRDQNEATLNLIVDLNGIIWKKITDLAKKIDERYNQRSCPSIQRIRCRR